MRFLKVCSTVVGLGLLLILTSCSEKETTRDDTENFIVDLQSVFANAYMSESSQILESFSESEPPGPSLSSTGSLEASTQNLRALRAPFGIDTLYGTWDYVDIQGWVHVDPDDPENAVLFTWTYLDTAMDDHEAEVLIDSLEFYEGTADTLPTSIWIGINSDDNDIAWIKFGAHYVSDEQADSVSLVYRIINYFEFGASITTNVDVDVEIDTTFLDSLDFVGTVHLWAENLETDYGVDYRFTRNANDTWQFVFADSRDWRMVVNLSQVVETDGEDERRDVTGEITHNGEHAADIEGYIWAPDDGNHGDMITIIFSDDTEGDYTYVSGVFKGFLE